MTAAAWPRWPHPTAGLGLDIIRAACRAPSIHNTQPWSWRLAGTSLELYADHARRLAHADPGGRNLTISCGTALHHAQVAARGSGWQPVVERWPDGTGSDLLARVTLEPARCSAEDAVLLATLHERRTDRRRFTSWPVQGERLARLVDVAASWGVEAVALTDVVDRVRTERLVAGAHATQAADPDLVVEHRRWTDGTDDGLREPEHHVAATDGMVVLCAPDDERDSWLAVGEALGAVWLDAVTHGLSIVPFSQVVEVAETRASLQHEVLGNVAVPHLLLRVGWQAIGRDQLVRTPRRPLTDVVRP